MLQAIWMPQPAPVPILGSERHLLSLTRLEMESCGQPLPRYPVSGYERSRPDSDTRCRSGTKSGDFRSKCGKRPKRGKFERKCPPVDGATRASSPVDLSAAFRKVQSSPGPPAGSECCPVPDKRVHIPCISGLRGQLLEQAAFCRLGRPKFRAGLGESCCGFYPSTLTSVGISFA